MSNKYDFHGGLSKGSYIYVSFGEKKTTENSERFGLQARPGIEPGTSRPPVLLLLL